MHKIGYIALGGIFLGLPIQAQAQSIVPDRLSLGFQLDLRHDSNVANSSAERAAARDLERSDQIISPAATLAVEQAIGRHSITGNAYVGYDFHARNPRLDSERIALSSGMNLDFRYCEVMPSVSYTRAQSDLGNLILLDDELLQTENIQSEQQYGVNLSCGGIVGLRPQAGVSYSKGDNSSLLRQRSDFHSFQYSAGLGYRQPSVGDLSVIYSKTKTRFQNRLIDGMHDGYDVQRVTGSIRRDIGARLSGDAHASWISTSARAGLGQNFEGIGYGAGLTLRATPQMQIRANINRDVQTSLNNDALYTLDESYGVDMDYALNSRISLNAGYTLEQREYEYSEFLAPLPADALLDETYHRVTGGINYRRTDRMGLSLYGGYEKRAANGTLFDYDGYFVGLRLNYAFTR